MKSICRKSVVAFGATTFAVLLLIPLSARADDDFDLRLEPIVLEVLNTSVDTDSSVFQEYRDVSSGFRIPVLQIEGNGEQSDRHLSIFGENIWREDARMTGDYGIWGHYVVRMDYNKIPHRFGNNGTLLWNVTGPGMLQLADSTQLQLQTAIESAPARSFDLIESLLDPFLVTSDSVNLALRRDRFDGEVEFAPLSSFSWAIDYEHENRNGNRAVGTSFGFNNTQEIPEPIDYDTSTIGLRGEWTGKKSGLQFGYRYSEFENQVDTLTWDNPLRATDQGHPIAYLGPIQTTAGPERGIYDLAPNNEADTLWLNGRSRLGEDWWVAGQVSSTRLEQTDTLQAYTLNTALVGVDYVTGATFDPTDPANLPARAADLEADLLSLDLDVGGDLGEDWKVKLSYDYYDYDASVPRLEFDGYVRTHAVWEEVPRVTVPYNYSRQKIGARVIWDPTRSSRLSASFHVNEWDRENRETSTTDENIFRLTWDQDFGQKWDVRAHWETGDREVGRYETEAQLVTFLDPHGINNQPGLRKYVQADREFDDFGIEVYYYPSGAVQVMFAVSSNDTDYPDSEFGLVSSELTAVDFEVSYAPREELNLYLFANVTEGESFQRARQSGAVLSTDPDNDWEATLSEDNALFGAGLTARLGDRWVTDLTAQWSEADGLASFFTTPAGSPSSAEPIPNYDDWELFFIKLDLAYEISERSKAGVWYWYEDYKLDSFLVNDLSNYVAGLIALNANFGDYQADVFGLYLSLDF